MFSYVLYRILWPAWYYIKGCLISCWIIISKPYTKTEQHKSCNYSKNKFYYIKYPFWNEKHLHFIVGLRNLDTDIYPYPHAHIIFVKTLIALFYLIWSIRRYWEMTFNSAYTCTCVIHASLYQTRITNKFWAGILNSMTPQ